MSIALMLLLTVRGQVPLVLDAKATQTVMYGVVHKLHHVEGVSHELTGAAVELPDGTIKAAIKAAVATFDSGNGNRDSHMKEVVDAAHFPDVSVKAVMPNAVPKAFPAEASGQAQLLVSLHGVDQQVALPVKMTFADSTHVHVVGSFEVSWLAFKIERPSLLFVPIDDKGDIKFDLTWVAKGP
jgi:hypothetical protein